MARMLGKVRPPWCPQCRRPPGPDCADESRSKRQVRRDEDRVWRGEMYDYLLACLELDAYLDDQAIPDPR